MFASVVNTAKANNIDLKILFETHSKTMIDTIGDCIEEKIISSDQVNVTLFQKDPQENVTEVNFSSFDCNGFLENWPIGFFQVETNASKNRELLT
ncbi:hypothetical protein A3752_14915 [Oleiphilus sp. HI0081]|nr:hypothetical protein A3752_14915 [Oleiphilus sp. HI0081]